MKILPTLILSATIISVQCSIYRLPDNVRPLRYLLTIEPNLTDVGWEPSLFWGDVQIELEILEDTQNVTLHATEIDIEESSISVIGSGGEVGINSTNKLIQDQAFIIHLEEALLKNKFYNLTIAKFRGQMISNSRGLFKVHYDYKDQERVAVVSQFQPTFARYAFPCFDEPQLKAKFVVSLIRPKQYSSITNEALEFTEFLGGDRYKDTFKETPPMPTYSVAFAVSDFQSTRKLERHRILAQNKAFENDELECPLLMSVKMLKALEEYIGINFTLSKVDIFAVPSIYFEPLAMENWGLITYDESGLKCTNSLPPRSLSHELAHQWFGSLVTPASWDYMWLSESFSTYFQHYITGIIQPLWKIMDQFVLNVVQLSFISEEKSGGYPLNYRISSYGEFPPDHIMYEKGGSIVRMMSHFLTNEVFRAALHNYILEKQFTSVVPDDLYKSVQKTVVKEGVERLLGGMTFGAIMGTWDTFKGYPTVTITRNYTSGNINIAQESVTFGDGQVWIIPINYVISSKGVDFSKTTADLWLVDPSTVLENMPTDGWVIVNKQQFGYYRVNYDLENWERLIQVLKSDKFETIHSLNRAQLLNDAFYFASLEKIPIDIPFRLAEYLVREKDHIPFAAFCNSYSHYTSIYSRTSKLPLRNNIAEPEDDGYTRADSLFTVLQNAVLISEIYKNPITQDSCRFRN